MLKKFIQVYKKFKESEQKRKQIFLFEQAKEHYYQQLKQNSSQDGEDIDGVNIPEFVVQQNLKRYAYTLALKELRKVIEECRVDECYKKCVMSAKKKTDRFISLIREWK